MEMMYQFFVSIGLTAAAALARMTGHTSMAGHWEKESARLKTGMLEDPQYRLWDRKGWVKRRREDGTIQETIQAKEEAHLPDGVPLSASGTHFLRPDAAGALPVAMGFVPPESPVARYTMDQLENLWNQDWDTGGYGRYHVSSEPDSPGAWPFPSLFIARASLETGDYDRVWRILRWLNSMPGAVSGSWFENYGPRLSPPFPQVGIPPWIWAEIVQLLVHHVLGVRPRESGLVIRPRLLPGMKRASAVLPVRGRRVKLTINRVDKAKESFQASTKVLCKRSGTAVIAYGSGDIEITAGVA
jgi:hypothetical protein